MADDAMAGVYANLVLRAADVAAARLDSLTSPWLRAPRKSSPSAPSCSAPRALDTNSLYISERLAGLGIDLRIKSVVGDERDDLAALLRPGAGARPTWSCSPAGWDRPTTT